MRVPERERLGKFKLRIDNEKLDAQDYQNCTSDTCDPRCRAALKTCDTQTQTELARFANSSR